MYGYNDLFNGVGEADEYYCRAAFKGKRDAECQGTTGTGRRKLTIL